jgi:hypothetical protein
MRSKNFYVLVAQASAPEELCITLTGLLKSQSFSEAEVETGHYREWLNKDIDPDKFFVVVAYNEDQVKGHKDFERFKDNHVTEKHGQVGPSDDGDDVIDCTNLFRGQSLL